VNAKLLSACLFLAACGEEPPTAACPKGRAMTRIQLFQQCVTDAPPGPNVVDQCDNVAGYQSTQLCG
jgi:hypothetical protein